MARSPETIFSLGYKLGSVHRLFNEALKLLQSMDGTRFTVFMRLYEASQDLHQAYSLLLAIERSTDAQIIKNVVTHLDTLLGLPLLGSPKAWTPREEGLDKTLCKMKDTVQNIFTLVSHALETQSWEKAI